MAGKPLKLSEFLPFRLSLASNRVSRAIAATYEEEFGLSMTQWRVMAVLGERPGLSATELTELTALDKVAISRAVSGLISSGFLERRAEPGDGRRSALWLTADGGRVYEEVIPRAVRLEEALLDRLPEEARRALDHALDLLAEAAKAQGAAPRNEPKASPR